MSDMLNSSNKALLNAQNEAKNLAYSKVLERAQKDLFYLSKYILDYDLMTENTHQELCNLTTSLLPTSYKALQGPSNIKVDS